MSNPWLALICILAYSLGPCLLLPLACIAARRGEGPNPDRLGPTPIRLALFCQNWFGGASVLAFLVLTGQCARLQGLFTVGIESRTGFLGKTILFVALFQALASRERNSRRLANAAESIRPSSIRQAVGNLSGSAYPLFLFNVIVLPSFLEEFLFRYLFLCHASFDAMEKISLLAISSFLFAWIHRECRISHFLAGLALGGNCLLTGSFLECALLHLANNLWVEISFRMRNCVRKFRALRMK